MADVKISDSIVYIGVDDKDIDLFESQYEVPNGVSYNSYLILDEKIAVMDTADVRLSNSQVLHRLTLFQDFQTICPILSYQPYP